MRVLQLHIPGCTTSPFTSSRQGGAGMSGWFGDRRGSNVHGSNVPSADVFSKAFDDVVSLFGSTLSGHASARKAEDAKSSFIRQRQSFATGSTAADGKAAAMLQKANQITFMCQAEALGQQRMIVLCQDQSFEDFLDYVENEFGHRHWPIKVEPSGKTTLIDKDELFDSICDEATIDGNKMMLLMVDKMPESIDDDDD